MYKRLLAPLCVQWEVTGKCNFSCIHCYNYWCRNDGHIDKNQEVRYWDSAVREIVENRVFHVVITGGEPLLVINDLFPYIKRLKDNGISFSINSNVSILTDEIADRLKELGISSFLVSLPCIINTVNEQITSYEGATEVALKGIQMLIDKDIPFSVNMVVTKLNNHYIIDTAKQLSDIGVKSFCATKSATPSNCPDFSDYNLSTPEFILMLKDLIYVRNTYNMNVASLEAYPQCIFGDDIALHYFRNRRCTAGKSICAIGFNGDIKPCAHSSKSYGNIKEGLIPAWNNMDDWRSNKYIPQECSDCKRKYTCSGGCKVEALTQNGRMDAVDPYSDCSYKFNDEQSDEQTFEIQLATNYVLVNKVRYRPEYFGGILFYSLRNWMAITEIFYNFLLEKKTICGYTLINELGISKNQTEVVINELLRKNIIEREDTLHE